MFYGIRGIDSRSVFLYGIRGIGFDLCVFVRLVRNVIGTVRYALVVPKRVTLTAQFQSGVRRVHTIVLRLTLGRRFFFQTGIYDFHKIKNAKNEKLLECGTERYIIQTHKLLTPLSF